MTDHIYRKFSEHIKVIKTILQNDATFREICEDYEEICTWLAFSNRLKPLPSAARDHTREVIRNLEKEIKKALKDAGF
jgi:hypothetical protein